MNVLFIGGTGVISTASSHETVSRGNNLWLLNRGTRNHRAPDQAHLIKVDMEQMTDSDASFIRSRSWDLEGVQFVIE